LQTSMWIACSSGRVRIRGWMICEQPRSLWRGNKSRRALNRRWFWQARVASRRGGEKKGSEKIFTEGDSEWGAPGCSMCIGMNADVLPPHERSASTSNRNFEGRQGRDSRTHLVSPVMAAAAALVGHFVDVREFDVAHVE